MKLKDHLTNEIIEKWLVEIAVGMVTKRAPEHYEACELIATLGTKDPAFGCYLMTAGKAYTLGVMDTVYLAQLVLDNIEVKELEKMMEKRDDI